MPSLEPFIIELASLSSAQFCLAGWRFLLALKGVGRVWPPMAQPEGPEGACQSQCGVNRRVPWFRQENGERETEDIDSASDEQESVEDA
jgi:hypothetical protein